jgi:ABC-type transporter Mla subunit MlaD
MTAVAEVVALLDQVAKGISNLRSIIKAARDGYAYLERYHSDARDDLGKLLEELRKLGQLLAEASSIVTHFDFTVSGSGVGEEPARFNRLLIEHKSVFQQFEDQLDDTRTRSGRVGAHYWALQAKAEQRRLGNAFGLLKTSKRQAEKLNKLLRDVYANDSIVIEEFQKMADAVRLALDDVRAALGPVGESRVENVRKAARRLGRHAANFQPIESNALFAVRELRGVLVDLHQTPAAPPQLVPSLEEDR